MTTPPIPLGFWDGYPPGLRPAQPPVSLGNAGGLSGSELWSVEAPDGPLLLRAWPSGTSRARVEQVHRWLDPLARFPWVAFPLSDRRGETLQASSGRIWEVTRFLPGRSDPGRPPSPTRLRLMIEAMAGVHAALAERTSTLGPSPGLLGRREELLRLLSGEFRDLRRWVEPSPATSERRLALAWIDRAPQSAPTALRQVEAASARSFPLQPVLRDARPEHFLFEGDALTGLVDFGAMGRDSIAGDLARLLGEASATRPDVARPALAAYTAVRLLSPDERAAIDAFAAANAVLGGARWVRWHFVEGRRFDDPTAVAAGLRRAVDRLSD